MIARRRWLVLGFVFLLLPSAARAQVLGPPPRPGFGITNPFPQTLSVFFKRAGSSCWGPRVRIPPNSRQAFTLGNMPFDLLLQTPDGEHFLLENAHRYLGRGGSDFRQGEQLVFQLPFRKNGQWTRGPGGWSYQPLSPDEDRTLEATIDSSGVQFAPPGGPIDPQPPKPRRGG